MPKISVIVPTYNREKTIKKCIDSLINQTMKDIEIIIIDDGSTDNTSNIIPDDNRIKYIKRSNHGIGASRNYGIDNSHGEYIVFVDSDDYISNDCLEKMYNKAMNDNLDFVVGDYYYIYESGNKEKIKLKDFENSSLKENPYLVCNVNLGPCNKLIKKSTINNIRFPENIKYEDVPFVVNVLKNANKIGHLNEALFYFLTDNKSETTIRDDKIFDIFKSLDLVVESLKDNYSEPLKKLVISIIVNYTIQQRYIKNRKMRNKFIDEAFIYIKTIDPNYKNNSYFKERNFFKGMIEKNKIFTKFYCDIYNIVK